jgi:hypothetical protein
MVLCRHYYTITWQFLGHAVDIVTKAQQCLCDLNDGNEVSTLGDSDIDLEYVTTFSSSESDSADLDGEDSQSE